MIINTFWFLIQICSLFCIWSVFISLFSSHSFCMFPVFLPLGWASCSNFWFSSSRTINNGWVQIPFRVLHQTNLVNPPFSLPRTPHMILTITYFAWRYMWVELYEMINIIWPIGLLGISQCLLTIIDISVYILISCKPHNIKHLHWGMLSFHKRFQ